MCQYMKKHHKTYSHSAEFLLRKTKVSQSVEALQGMGAGFGLTPMSDQFRIPQNIALSLLHHKQVSRSTHQKHVYKTPPNLPILDWRTSGQYVTSVVDQGVCGDCFAFASAAVLEYWLAKTGSPLEPISSQLLMDCTSGSGRPDMGCEGGLMEYVFEYAKHHPVALQREQPYEGQQQRCPSHRLKSHLRVLDYRVLLHDDDSRAEEQLEHLLHTYGPIAVGIDSTSMAMENYRGGIFRSRHCSKNIDHAVTIVGYTKDAWIIKNSWGPNWGRDGYLYLERGQNACGVAEYIVYITDAASTTSAVSTDWQYEA